MQLVFGLDLDGAVPAPGEGGLGRMVVGRAGLLDLLEQGLGFPPGEEEGLARLLVYRSALAAVLEGGSNPTFAESFARDSLATAGVLLRWRDELVLAGWDGKAEGEGVPARLRELAAAERNFGQDGTTGFGEGDRLGRVLGRLGRAAPAWIEEVVCEEAEAELPTRWRELMETLGAEFRPEPNPSAAPPDRVEILTGSTATVLARLLAERMGGAGESAGSAVLVAGREDEALLGEAFREAGLPGIGCSIELSAAAALQLPLLLSRLLWLPFDPQHLLEFLHHEPNPLSRPVRSSLGRALNDSPGYGNLPWREALKHLRTTAEESDDPSAAARLEKALALWLPEPMHDPAAGAPAAELAELVLALAQWAGPRAAEDPLLAALSRHGHRLARILGGLGADPLDRATWERFLGLWLAGCRRQRAGTPELGGVLRAHRPAHVRRDFDHVLWWRPPGMPVARPTWSRAERDWLEAHGVCPVDPEIELARSARADLRPLTRCRARLTIVHLTQEKNEPIPDPPVVTRLTHGPGKEVLRDAEGVLGLPLENGAERHGLAVEPLPRPRRWWDLREPGLLPPRSTSSFTSLQAEIWSPGDWVFRYRARLRRGRLLEWRCVDNLLRRGSLLHEVVEELVDSRTKPEPGPADPGQEAAAAPLLATLLRKLLGDGAEIEGGDWRSLTETDLRSWVASQWDAMLRDQAAHLLVPGAEAARTGLLHTAQRALWRLLEHLREAGVCEAKCEQKLETDFLAGTRIGGRIDLLVRTGTGQVGVIDLKLGGLTSRKKELDRNLHLQLATYARLLEGSGEEEGPGDGSEVSCGYFVFSRARLLARTEALFPHPEHLAAGAADEWRSCWSDFEQVWGWRREQLDAGRIEFPSKEARPWSDGSSVPPGAPHWASPDDAAKWSEFDMLRG